MIIILSRSRLASLVCIVVAAAPLFFVSYQIRKVRRFEFGSMDRSYIARTEQFYGAAAMSGPIRHASGRVEVIDFYGRLTRRNAVLSLPYLARGSDLRLHIRCHRFGLQGTVSLDVNGKRIDDYTFTERSYPWGGIAAEIPEEVARRGPLTLGLRTQGGKVPPSHLPSDVGVGIDWIRVEPVSGGAWLLPTLREWIGFYAWVLLGLLFFRQTGSRTGTPWIVAALTGSALVATALAPVEAALALGRLAAIVFPIGLALRPLLGVVLSRRIEPGHLHAETHLATRLFVVACLAHSLLLFFPNHLPPDVPNHGKQVEWLEERELTLETLAQYSDYVSRQLTEGPVLMNLGESRTVEAREGENSRAYGSPYPPFFYLFTFLLLSVHDDLRFLLELVPVALGALMLVMVFVMAWTIWAERTIARFAAVLMLLEISIWHHAHRGHGPGLFGAAFVLAFVALVALRAPGMKTVRSGLPLALPACIAALSYAVAPIQLGFFVATLTVLLAISRDERILAAALALGSALGAAGAVILYYGPYVLDALERSRFLLEGGAYAPPAAFFFLRNQMRDTVRIYLNGFPLYLLLSAAGLVLLRRSGASSAHQKLLWSAALTFALLLVLKDPLVFPRILLHAKEDLFYASFACLLGALPLSALWSRRVGRRAAALLLAVLSYLAAKDQAHNANTLRSQPIEGESASRERTDS